MTPSEKANELFDKMYSVEDQMGDYPMCFKTAKQCAKIAIEEIIKNSFENYSGADVSDNEILSDSKYWNEVLKEIEKI